MSAPLPADRNQPLGPFKAGLDWVYRSVMLFRKNPPKWLMHALLYVILFVMMPSIPAMPVLVSLVIILFWPTFLALFMGIYREADLGRDTEPRVLVEEIRPNFIRLITLGGMCLAYGILAGVLVKTDTASLADLVNQKAEAEVLMAQAVPLILKMLLLLAPMIMASWFSPMLIAFQGYPVLEAIKHSIWQCGKNMIAITVAWAILTIALLVLMLVAGIVMSIITAMSAFVGGILMGLVVFGMLLVMTYFLLAIQYFSYRHVYYHPEAASADESDEAGNSFF